MRDETSPAREHRARGSTPARTLPSVVGRFIETEVASGAMLLTAAAVALVWANSPWADTYRDLWQTRVVVAFGAFDFTSDLRHLVNDGLMAVFFFVVGLEIKREIFKGELADRRVAALPAFAAAGGMLVPVAVYALVVGGGDAGAGWGIPMATDIAFALGVLALLGKRVPASLKLFVLTLAVVDDIGAILVIALFYGDSLEILPLIVAVGGVAVTFLLRRARVDWTPVYVALALVAWYATYLSGVHATIAGVALAFATPIMALAPAETVRRWAQRLTDEPTGTEVHQMTILARESASPGEYLEAVLHPTASFLVLPVFALANAGVELRGGLFDTEGAPRLMAGIVLGLVVGKLVGILGASWLAVRLRLAVLPADVQWHHVAGAASLGGVGFTVSLFIANLAFPNAALADVASLAVLVASVLAAALGSAILLLSRHSLAPE